MLRLALAPALPSAPFERIGFNWCLVGLLGRDNMEGPTARKLTSIRRSLKIKFLVIGKLANN